MGIDMNDLDKQIMEHEMRLNQIKRYVEHQNKGVDKENMLAGKYGTLLELAATNMSTSQTCALVESMVLDEIRS